MCLQYTFAWYSIIGVYTQEKHWKGKRLAGVGARIEDADNLQTRVEWSRPAAYYH
jgi:hypothetical protein